MPKRKSPTNPKEYIAVFVYSRGLHPYTRGFLVQDRVVTSTRDRRNAVLDVIRGASRRLALSLFRCNDDEVFAELARAVARGVAVDVLTTARAKGGRKRLEKLGTALA